MGREHWAQRTRKNTQLKLQEERNSLESRIYSSVYHQEARLRKHMTGGSSKIPSYGNTILLQKICFLLRIFRELHVQLSRGECVYPLCLHNYYSTSLSQIFGDTFFTFALPRL